MKISVSEKEGELSFGLFWVSLDGRLQTVWYRTFRAAQCHYIRLETLRRHPSILVRLEDEQIKRMK